MISHQTGASTSSIPQQHPDWLWVQSANEVTRRLFLAGGHFHRAVQFPHTHHQVRH